MPTDIEWSDETWNPVTGCTRVSAGCDNCYAVTMTRRLAAMGQEKYKGLVNPGKGHFNGVVKTHPDELEKPLRWRKPRRVFVNSMSDLFHEGVDKDFILRVWMVMADTPQHTYQILTKRPEQMWHLLHHWMRPALTLARTLKPHPWPLPNVWLGTSVENQQTADERIPHLLKCPASVRFLSCEPLLGPLDLTLRGLPGWDEDWKYDVLRGKEWASPRDDFEPSSPKVDWVIVGGESGLNARPMRREWARSIRDQCQEARVPFFFKQWGGVNKKQHGRLLDHREWNEYPT